ncbi:MAG: hypothetical protein KAR06_00850 [Deltaproteobacteria bacterium]|nr:hypothetical protein [Deltaproteobacteria bacterium]
MSFTIEPKTFIATLVMPFRYILQMPARYLLVGVCYFFFYLALDMLLNKFFDSTDYIELHMSILMEGILVTPLNAFLSGIIACIVAEQLLDGGTKFPVLIKTVYGKFGTLIMVGLVYEVLMAFLLLPKLLADYSTAFILTTLLLVVALPLFIYLMGSWMFAFQAVIFEGKSTFSALSRSSMIIKYNWWGAVLYLVSSAVIIFAIPFYISVYFKGYIFINYFFIAFAVVYFPILLTVLYFKFRSKKYSYDLNLLKWELDQAYRMSNTDI